MRQGSMLEGALHTSAWRGGGANDSWSGSAEQQASSKRVAGEWLVCGWREAEQAIDWRTTGGRLAGDWEATGDLGIPCSCVGTAQAL